MQRRYPKPDEDRLRRNGATAPPAGTSARIREAVSQDVTLGALWLQLFDDADP